MQHTETKHRVSDAHIRDKLSYGCRIAAILKVQHCCKALSQAKGKPLVKLKAKLRQATGMSMGKHRLNGRKQGS